MKPIGFIFLITCFQVTACSDNSNNTTDLSVVETSQVTEARSIESVSNESIKNPDEDSPVRTAIIGASEIPYPVYPNGSKYRVGDENGLKIVLYQTNDAFEDVDQYYRAKAEGVGMPRLAAMSDYVRYAISTDDNDPWEISRPGIVIHRFNDDTERDAVGADQEAVTNIIMSF